MTNHGKHGRHGMGNEVIYSFSRFPCIPSIPWFSRPAFRPEFPDRQLAPGLQRPKPEAEILTWRGRSQAEPQPKGEPAMKGLIEDEDEKRTEQFAKLAFCDRTRNVAQIARL